MSKRILVSVDPYEARAALMDGDRLVNVEIESSASNKRKGNVYRGKVTAVEPGIDAAFVDYGAAKDGFLPFDEVAAKSLSGLTGHTRAGSRSGLKIGDWVLVQVTKEEVGKKGASLTMHVSLPGRFVVLMPFSDRTGISRKLGGEERARLRQIASQLQIPEGYGCIVRTVGEDEALEDLQADLDAQVAAWESILKNFESRKGAGEVHEEAGLALRFVRDYMSSDVNEVWVEDESSYRELAGFLESRMPQRRQQLKRYAGDMPLFLKYGVERQIEALLNHKVALPSGGSIVVGQTEALVAIDVNSGRTRQKDIEDTAFRTNLEAAREVARQVVLRDLGGIIVVDFIDMESEAHRRAIEEELKACFRWDKARLTFTRIQEFGLLSFSRQRLRQAVDSGITLPCPTCAGTGRVRSPNLLAMGALRRIRERLATQGRHAAFVEVTVPVEVANFLNNRKREALTGLEKKFDVLIDVLGNADALPDDLKLTVLGEIPHGRKSLHGYEETEDGEGTPGDESTADESQAGQMPAMAAHAPAETGSSPGRQRSFFRGLISKVLGLDELEEVPPPVPAREAAVRDVPAREVPVREPAPRPAPAPAPVAEAVQASAATPSGARAPRQAAKAATPRPSGTRTVPQRSSAVKPAAAPAREPREPRPAQSTRGSGRSSAPRDDLPPATLVSVPVGAVLPLSGGPLEDLPPALPHAAAAPSDGDAAAVGDSPSKKRRRRRRRSRGKGAEGAGADAANLATGSGQAGGDDEGDDEGPEDEGPVAAGAEGAVAAGAEGAEGGENGEESATRKRRRRRRRRGKGGAAGAEGHAGAEEAGDDQAGDDEPPPVPQPLPEPTPVPVPVPVPVPEPLPVPEPAPVPALLPAPLPPADSPEEAPVAKARPRSRATGRSRKAAPPADAPAPAGDDTPE